MSDFLQNLVARSRAPLEVVRPRTVSMFESAAPALPDMSDAGPLEEYDESVAPLASGRRRRPASSAPAAETIGPLEAPRELRDSLQAPPVLSNTAAPAIPPKNPEPAASPLFRKPEPAIIEKVIHQDGPAPDVEPAAHLAGPAPAAAREIREILRERETRVELRDRLTPRMPGETATQPTLRERLVQSLISAPSAQTRTEPQTHAVPAAEPAAEPVIHVSIGRIEVRAVSETPRGRTEKQAPPVMSLDEYLRSREKGASR